MSSPPLTATPSLEEQFTQEIALASTDLAIAQPDLGLGLGKRFEAWLYLKIAADLGPLAKARDSAGTSTADLIIRGGPGYMAPKTGDPLVEAGYFRIEGDEGPHLELHAGLRHKGLSGASHEIDISLNSRLTCHLTRSGTKAAPYPGAPVLGLELKQYDAAKALDKNFARALLGVAVDLDPCWLIGEIELVGRRRSLGAWHAPDRAAYRLVTTATLTPETVSFLDAYDIGMSVSVAPQTAGTTADLMEAVWDAVRFSC